MESQTHHHHIHTPNLLLITISLILILIANGTVHAARHSLSPATSPSSSPPANPTPASPTELPFISYKQFFPLKGHPAGAGAFKPPPAAPLQESKTLGFHAIGERIGRLGHRNSNPEIQKICDRTDYPPLCIAAVLPHVHVGGGGKITVDMVFSGAVVASNEFAKYCVGFAKKVAANPLMPAAERSVIEDCKDGYETMVDNFAEAMDASKKHDMGTMKSMLSAVLTFAGDCEDELEEMEMDSPLKGFAVKLKNMTSNCLAITDIMEGKPPLGGV